MTAQFEGERYRSIIGSYRKPETDWTSHNLAVERYARHDPEHHLHAIPDPYVPGKDMLIDDRMPGATIIIPEASPLSSSWRFSLPPEFQAAKEWAAGLSTEQAREIIHDFTSHGAIPTVEGTPIAPPPIKSIR